MSISWLLAQLCTCSNHQLCGTLAYRRVRAYSVLYMYEMKREYRHCDAVMGAPLHMQGAQFCQRTCTCSSRCFSCWVTGSLCCQTRLKGCYSRAASWSKMAPSSATCRYTAVPLYVVSLLRRHDPELTCIHALLQARELLTAAVMLLLGQLLLLCIVARWKHVPKHR